MRKTAKIAGVVVGIACLGGLALYGHERASADALYTAAGDTVGSALLAEVQANPAIDPGQDIGGRTSFAEKIKHPFGGSVTDNAIILSVARDFLGNKGVCAVGISEKATDIHDAFLKTGMDLIPAREFEVCVSRQGKLSRQDLRSFLHPQGAAMSYQYIL